VTGRRCHISWERPDDDARECETTIGDRKARERDTSIRSERGESDNRRHQQSADKACFASPGEAPAASIERVGDITTNSSEGIAKRAGTIPSVPSSLSEKPRA